MTTAVPRSAGGALPTPTRSRLCRLRPPPRLAANRPPPLCSLGTRLLLHPCAAAPGGQVWVLLTEHQLLGGPALLRRVGEMKSTRPAGGPLGTAIAFRGNDARKQNETSKPLKVKLPYTSFKSRLKGPTLSASSKLRRMPSLNFHSLFSYLPLKSPPF